MKLRPYQEAAVESIPEYFTKAAGNPILALPTGTGKSVIIGEFVKRALTSYPGTRIMMLTHVKELIEQNFDKLLRLWPTAPAGIYSAGLKRRDTSFPITYAGIASVNTVPELFGRIDLILIDECHLVSPNDTTMYRSFIEALRVTNPFIKVVGFTATKYRLGVGLLTAEGGLFTDICYDLTTMEEFNFLIDQAYLAPLIPKRTAMTYDVENVKLTAGEFNQVQLQEAVDKSELTYAACRETMELGFDRKHWLVFASGIEHAEHVADTFNGMGIATCVVHSKLKDAVRDQYLRDYKAGKYRCCVNNNVLTTGFDFPGIDLISVMRPTSSTSLWVQMLGRGTRPLYASGFDLDDLDQRRAAFMASGKVNCLVLDFAGNTKRLGPINDPVIPRAKGKGAGEAPVKVCENCGTYNHASVRFCCCCGAEFPKELKIQGSAYGLELIKLTAEKPQMELFKVDRVIYTKHDKLGSVPSMRVSYYCGLRRFDEWVCFEHSGFPLKKAHTWWRERSHEEIPTLVDTALEGVETLKVPASLSVWINKKYPEIMGVFWE